MRNNFYGYPNLFNTIHLEAGSGLEYKEDPSTITIKQARNIINSVLNEYAIADLKTDAHSVQKYFYEKFINKGISIYKIESILGVNHQRIKRIITKNIT